MTENFMLEIHSWPQAIVHIDADAFFASVEQVIHPEYRGKAIVTGKERGIAASFSYEAKRLGITRAMPLHEIKRNFPQVIIVPSDYETYSLFSKRMFAIMQRFSPEVEEYSIDEGFSNLNGLRKVFRKSYDQIGYDIKEAIQLELGLTVSVGISLSKTLAKLASEYQKPNGFTSVSGRDLDEFLSKVSIEKVCGFGPNISALLRKHGVYTVHNFVHHPQQFAQKLLGKIGDELWRELRGEYVYKVNSEEKTSYQSISKMKTFTPPSTDKRFVYGQLIRNLEGACIKARRYSLSPSHISIGMRLQDFSHTGVEMTLSRATNHPMELIPFVKDHFEKLFNPHALYRATYVVLHHFVSDVAIQVSLFDDVPKLISVEKIFHAIDEVNEKYGKHTVHMGSSMTVNTFKRHQGERGDAPERVQTLLPGETKRQRLKYPMMYV